MSRRCEVCGKGPTKGNQVAHRGKAKYLGGVGTKITGITRRVFLPNLKRVRITTDNGTNRRIRICTQCMRSGAITRLIRSAPFRLPVEAGDKSAGQVGDKGAASKAKRKARAKSPAQAKATG
jgi:large subunit ribosomal protein L28